MRDSTLRALWIQSFVAITLCFLVLASEVALVATDRQISDAIVKLTEERAFQERLERGPSGRHGTKRRSARPEPSLVVLVSIEALRADHVESYGYERDTAPRLEALAADGFLFETAYAQAAHALVSEKSLFTGKYPSSLMLEETSADFVDLSTLDLPREYLVRTFSSVPGMLAARLRSAGYRTAAFTDGGWVSAEHGFDPGFEVFDEDPEDRARIRNWLFERRGERAFLFVHSSRVRCPYRADEPYDSLFCSALEERHSSHADLTALCGGGDTAQEAAALQALTDHYDGSVAQADAELGSMIDTLRELSLYDDALIAVAGVFGESLGERGAVGHGDLVVEQLHVPLALKLPSSWGCAPRRITEPVELVDLAPTLLSAAGASAPDDLDGHSLLPIVLRGVRGRRYLVAQTTLDEAPTKTSNAAKRTLLAPGSWQLIQDGRGDGIEFFALDRDPQALNPVLDLGDLSELDIPPVLQRLLSRPLPEATTSEN